MVTVNMQAEMTVIKEKLINFVNGIREEAEPIYQDKYLNRLQS